MSPIQTPWEDDMTSGSVTFGVFTGSPAPPPPRLIRDGRKPPTVDPNKVIKTIPWPEFKAISSEMIAEDILKIANGEEGDVEEKASMKGSTMFWIAMGISVYIYGTYLVIHNKIFVNEDVFLNFINNNPFGWEGIVMFIWLLCSLIIAGAVSYWFTINGGMLMFIKPFNKFLDNVLK